MFVGDYRSALQSATAHLHGEIDALYGEFDLGQPDGLSRFLVAHAIGMRACQPSIARFGEQGLGCRPPDYSKVLERDLAMLGVDLMHLPRIELPARVAALETDAGVFYVVAGSRMGAAVLRERATALTASGPASSACGYFAVGEGPAMWRLFRIWLSSQGAAGRGPANEPCMTPVELPALIDAAMATFQLFAHAARWAASHHIATKDTGGIAA